MMSSVFTISSRKKRPQWMMLNLTQNRPRGCARRVLFRRSCVWSLPLSVCFLLPGCSLVRVNSKVGGATPFTQGTPQVESDPLDGGVIYCFLFCQPLFFGGLVHFRERDRQKERQLSKWPHFLFFRHRFVMSRSPLSGGSQRGSVPVQDPPAPRLRGLHV